MEAQNFHLTEPTTLTFEPHHVVTIIEALGELQHKVAKPVSDSIFLQLHAQAMERAAAAKQAQATPEPPMPPPPAPQLVPNGLDHV